MESESVSDSPRQNAWLCP